MYFPLFVRVLCLSVLLCITLCSLKFFDQLVEEEKAGCFVIIVLQVYCYYKCSLALPHNAVR